MGRDLKEGSLKERIMAWSRHHRQPPKGDWQIQDPYKGRLVEGNLVDWSFRERDRSQREKGAFKKKERERGAGLVFDAVKYVAVSLHKRRRRRREKKEYLYLAPPFVCVCVRACVRARVRACQCVCEWCADVCNGLIVVTDIVSKKTLFPCWWLGTGLA